MFRKFLFILVDLVSYYIKAMSKSSTNKFYFKHLHLKISENNSYFYYRFCMVSWPFYYKGFLLFIFNKQYDINLIIIIIVYAQYFVIKHQLNLQ